MAESSKDTIGAQPRRSRPTKSLAALGEFGTQRGRVEAGYSVKGRGVRTDRTRVCVARANKKLMHVPVEDTVREGFFEPEQFQAVCAKLPEDLQTALNIMHTFGWRKREALDLERRQLDLAVGTVRLDVGSTKNKEGRVVYRTTELKTQLAAQVAGVQALEKQLGKIIPWLSHESPGGHPPG